MRRVRHNRAAKFGCSLSDVGGNTRKARDRRTLILRKAQLLPLVQNKREVCELRNEQCNTQQQNHLTGETPRKKAVHICRTSAVSMYPPPHTVLIRLGLAGSGSIFLRS